MAHAPGMIPQMTQIKLPAGQVINLADFNQIPVWSTADFLTGFDDERIDFFTYVSGSPVSSTQNITTKRTATDTDTNVAINNGMAATEEMYVYSIQIEYIELATDDENETDATTALPRQGTNPIPLAQRLAIFQYLLRFELEVSLKVKHECKLAQLNTGFGVFAAASSMPTIAATPTQAFGNAGLPSNDAVRPLSVPVHIGQTEKYLARIRNPSGLAVDFGVDMPGYSEVSNALMRVAVILDGLHKIPVA